MSITSAINGTMPHDGDKIGILPSNEEHHGHQLRTWQKPYHTIGRLPKQ